jgi:alpha-N-acetylgalactosaminidase
MDDCWEEKHPPRDPTTNELRGDGVRFASGMKALGDYVHAAGLSFAMYTAESTETCGGYPASANYEALDAQTFAAWGVDYLKVDGCGPGDYYPHGYQAMGAALEASGRDIVYSCSWPAYIGSNESVKPFGTFIDDGCNLWRAFNAHRAAPTSLRPHLRADASKPQPDRVNPNRQLGRHPV